MIGKLVGIVEDKSGGSVLLDVHGVGYAVFATPATVNGVRKGSAAALWTHLHNRDETSELYGFLERGERDFFRRLISISGIGPRSALGILSIASAEAVMDAIAAGDSSYLTKVSGIGKKTAQKIILELKDTLPLGHEKAHRPGDADVIAALEALGYTPREAHKALTSVDRDIQNTEERLKAALKGLGTK